jgi:hypothetical protein
MGIGTALASLSSISAGASGSFCTMADDNKHQHASGLTPVIEVPSSPSYDTMPAFRNDVIMLIGLQA